MAALDTKWPLRYLVTSDAFYNEVEKRLDDPNERAKNDRTLLLRAAESMRSNCRIVQLLIVRGADLNSTGSIGATPLHLAVMSRNINNVFVLIKAGASVNSVDSNGRTALHHSIWQDYSQFYPAEIDYNIAIVEELLRHPEINLNPVDEEGETPLMLAVKREDSFAVDALLKKGANIDFPDKYRRTPLHVALSAQNVDEDIVTIFLENGAGIYNEDRFRQTPIDALLSIVRDERTLLFVVSCVYFIALRYRVTDKLRHKLDRIPNLMKFLNDCCEEVRIMKEVVIYDKVTLHDFSLDCFQKRVEDPVREIYTPVVEILSTGFIKMYGDFLFRRLSKADLRSVLQRTVGKSVALDLAPQDATNSAIFDAIKGAYDENVRLKGHLIELGEFLMRKM